MKFSNRIEELIAETLRRIDELDELVIETRELSKAATQQAKAANQQAKAATQQAMDSRFLLEKHIQWHEMSIKRAMPTEDEYLKEKRGLVAVLKYPDIPCDR